MKQKIVIKALAAVILILSFSATAFADWYDDVASGSTWVEIEGENFIAESFCGVNAYYNENDARYQCNELIMRFYKEAFGLDVMAYMNTGLIMLSEGYDFQLTKTPAPGDIIYAPAAQRGSSTDHWAIVESYSNGYIEMFEQNVVWEGKAGINRKIKFPSDSYNLYTPVKLYGGSKPFLKGYEPETTTEIITTTEITTENKTTEAVTTKKHTTTTTELTTTVETTKPTTTALSTTTTTTEKAETTTELFYTESTVYTGTKLTETTEHYSSAESVKKDNSALIITISVSFAILICIIVVCLVIRRRK